MSAVCRVLAVVAAIELAGASLFTPNLVACSAWVGLEIFIPFFEVQIDCLHGGILGLIVAAMDDGASHPAEYRFEDIQELRRCRERNQLH